MYAEELYHNKPKAMISAPSGAGKGGSNVDYVFGSDIWFGRADRVRLGKEQQMREDIKYLIEKYNEKIQELEEEIRTQKIGLSFLDGQRVALVQVVKNLEDILEDHEQIGHWLEKKNDNGGMFDKLRFYCSECGKWQTYGKTDFCPKCGANMRGGKA